METNKSRIGTDIDFDLDGFQTGTLRVPHSVDRSAYGYIPIPIAVLRNGDGPTVLLTGGTHGDEYEGPLALMKLLQRMPTMRITGRIIVVPGLNFPAFLAGKRNSPIDDANMARVFPGKRDGSITEVIAHYVDTELVPRADYIFDIHSGGASLNYMPTLLLFPPEAPDTRASYFQLANRLGAPRAMAIDLLGEDRIFAASAHRHGKPIFGGEFGGFATCHPLYLAIVEEAVSRLLKEVGVAPEEHVSHEPNRTQMLTMKGSSSYVYCPTPGIFEPVVELGQPVKNGDLIGRVYNPHMPWAAPLEMGAKTDGMVVCIRSYAGVEPGDNLVVVATDA
ncbi:succinylglutamate desuccinylase [Burkholderia sp. KK1]|nr:succinylglutamate desuccinylase [Burkholderia sp. KK1]